MTTGIPLIVKDGPWHRSAWFWKRLTVTLSIVFSIATLILGAFASLQGDESPAMIRRLTISSIVINSLSIALSALTSLDWQAKSTTDAKFAQQFLEASREHGVIVTKRASFDGILQGNPSSGGKATPLI